MSNVGGERNIWREITGGIVTHSLSLAQIKHFSTQEKQGRR